jgi:hypothetical protein
LLTGAPALVDPPPDLRSRVLAIPHGSAAEPAAAGPAPPSPVEAARREAWRWRRLSGRLLGAATAAVAAAALVLAFALTRDSGFHATRSLELWGTPHAGGSFRIGTGGGPNVPVELHVWGLPKPAQGYYETWLGKPGDRYSLGKFTVARDGSATVELYMPRGTERGYRWIWITREPRDGDPRPSKTTVLRASI